VGPGILPRQFLTWIDDLHGGFEMSFRGVPRLGAGAVLVGGAIATAVMLGSGAAHAAPGDDVVGVAAAADTTSSDDLLSTAATDFTDANTTLAGIDVSDAPSQLQSQLSEFISDQTGMLNTAVQTLNDSVGPVESTVLADSGSLSSLIDQWFFDPLNQDWASDGSALLNADQALDTAVISGSASDITSALQQVDVAAIHVLPTEFESIPLIVLADLLGDGSGAAAAGAAPDFFDLLLGL
jgi:hypothetical protein